MPDDSVGDSGSSIDNRHLCWSVPGRVLEWPWLVASPSAAIE
jgi:hypothetical protein